ncbi:tyrosinase family protein [Pseudomonas frederiksbergensis]|uniref:tyrosinase family protein n=1 Tax=Pseudomonas frederiksbergensis TaxID=104087 RepID=UPI00198043B0|nr:tyrosinase family protein [Pseudomonas frederiksbergensis]MBN3862261.1 tyrosinase family protein [Pseudomonas frederiksbergensis]
MIIRKDIRSLTAAERDLFINCVLELKRRGIYDGYIHAHHKVMIPTVKPDEPQHPDYRNGAHQGPAFLPWHRAFLLQFEAALQTVDSNVSVPYWDWSADATNPKQSLVWTKEWMGGDGDPNDHERVQDGPFAYAKGDWDLEPYPEYGYTEPGLRREFEKHVTSLPNQNDIGMAMKEQFYDMPPYSASPFNLGFRNRLEGWITQVADPDVTTPGSQLHNRVHLWIGGHMYWMISPSDPVFFLHHCFIDKIWADWQAKKQKNDPKWAPWYAPINGGPPGHNYNDKLWPFPQTVRAVMDITALGYQYEPVSLFQPSFPKSPFMAQ